jgi:hypothetical protein
MSDLPSQIPFSFLSVPHIQPILCTQDAVDDMDLDFVSQSGSSSSNRAESLKQDAYVPVNYFSPEVYALLAAAEASAERRALELDEADMEVDSTGQGLNLQDQSGPIQSDSSFLGCGLSSTAPPKKFYRTFWQSISLKLLDQLPRAALPSRAQFHRCGLNAET